MQISKGASYVIIAVALVAILAGGYMLFLKPKSLPTGDTKAKYMQMMNKAPGSTTGYTPTSGGMGSPYGGGGSGGPSSGGPGGPGGGYPGGPGGPGGGSPYGGPK